MTPMNKIVQGHLVELQKMEQEFGTQAFRQNDVGNITKALEAKVRRLENINGNVK